MSIRADVEAQFKADWADIPELSALVVVATERPLDDPRKATALIRTKRVGNTPEAPKSHRNVGLLLTLISPNVNADAAQDELDILLHPLLDYLDKRYAHDDAETVAWTGGRLAYDIPFTVISKKEA